MGDLAPELHLVSNGVVYVDIDDLRLGLSPRSDAHDDDHVKALAGVLEQLPPILVHASSMTIIDGVHRVLAARLRGQQRIRAHFFRGNLDEAYIKAVECNIAHGKPLSLAEREEAARKVLKIHVQWSDRRIASTCGLSPTTVGQLRARVTDGSGQLEARVGRDGKSRPVDAAKARRRVAQLLQENPDTSLRKVAAAAGTSQGTVRDVKARLQRGEDVLSPRLARRERRRQEPPPSPSKVAMAPPLQRVEPRFDQWLESRRLRSDADWEPWMKCIPIGRVYDVADEARRCGDVWHRFANALEGRARQRRRSRAVHSDDPDCC